MTLSRIKLKPVVIPRVEQKIREAVKPSQIPYDLGDIIGGKGLSLVQMKFSSGFAVPPFVVVTSEAVNHYIQYGEPPSGLEEELADALSWLEAASKKELGETRPLAVRGSPKRPLPGILPTSLDTPIKDVPDQIQRIANAWITEEARELRIKMQMPLFPSPAVVIQSMVWGNRGENCAAGVYFTSDPRTGVGDSGQVVLNGMGPQVMSDSQSSKINFNDFGKISPAAAAEIRRRSHILTHDWKDALEVEFTMEHSKVWYLQAKEVDRSAIASLQIAFRLASRKVIDWGMANKLFTEREQAILTADGFDQNILQSIDPVASGRPTAPGSTWGFLALSPERIEEHIGPHVFVAEEFLPPDARWFSKCRGVISKERVGAHTRAWALMVGIPAITAVTSLGIDKSSKSISFTHPDGRTTIMREGDMLSLDGKTGKIYDGFIPTNKSPLATEIERLSRRSDLWNISPKGSAESAALMIIKLRTLSESASVEPITEKHLPEWWKIKEKADKIPEMIGVEDEFIESAYLLLREYRFSLRFNIVLDTIIEQGWGRKHEQERFEFYDFDAPKVTKLLKALYYLDESPIKRICEAFCQVDYVDHGNALKILSYLDPAQKVAFINGLHEYAASQGSPPNIGDFIIPCFAFEQDINILSSMTDECIAYLMSSYYACPTRSQDMSKYTSSTIRARMPQISVVVKLLTQLGSRLERIIEELLKPKPLARRPSSEESRRANVQKNTYIFWQGTLLS